MPGRTGFRPNARLQKQFREAEIVDTSAIQALAADSGVNVKYIELLKGGRTPSRIHKFLGRKPIDSTAAIKWAKRFADLGAARPPGHKEDEPSRRASAESWLDLLKAVDPATATLADIAGQKARQELIRDSISRIAALSERTEKTWEDSGVSLKGFWYPPLMRGETRFSLLRELARLAFKIQRPRWKIHMDLGTDPAADLGDDTPSPANESSAGTPPQPDESHPIDINIAEQLGQLGRTIDGVAGYLEIPGRSALRELGHHNISYVRMPGLRGAIGFVTEEAFVKKLSIDDIEGPSEKSIILVAANCGAGHAYGLSAEFKQAELSDLGLAKTNCRKIVVVPVMSSTSMCETFRTVRDRCSAFPDVVPVIVADDILLAEISRYQKTFPGSHKPLVPLFDPETDWPRYPLTIAFRRKELASLCHSGLTKLLEDSPERLARLYARFYLEALRLPCWYAGASKVSVLQELADKRKSNSTDHQSYFKIFLRLEPFGNRAQRHRFRIVLDQRLDKGLFDWCKELGLFGKEAEDVRDAILAEILGDWRQLEDPSLVAELREWRNQIAQRNSENASLAAELPKLRQQMNRWENIAMALQEIFERYGIPLVRSPGSAL